MTQTASNAKVTLDFSKDPLLRELTARDGGGLASTDWLGLAENVVTSGAHSISALGRSFVTAIAHALHAWVEGISWKRLQQLREGADRARTIALLLRTCAGAELEAIVADHETTYTEFKGQLHIVNIVYAFLGEALKARVERPDRSRQQLGQGPLHRGRRADRWRAFRADGRRQTSQLGKT